MSKQDYKLEVQKLKNNTTFLSFCTYEPLFMFMSIELVHTEYYVITRHIIAKYKDITIKLQQEWQKSIIHVVPY